MLKREIDV